MVTISQLLFFFIALGTALCLLVLLMLSTDRSRPWYAVFLASYLGWVITLYAQPAWFQPAYNPWLNIFLSVLLPMTWIALLVRFGVIPNISSHYFPTISDEPRMTQEYLRGPGSRREVLTLYFALVTIGFIIISAFLYATQRF